MIHSIIHAKTLTLPIKKMLKILLSTTFLLLLFVGTSAATEYYVNTSGNDSNDGYSLDTAWGSISYAASQAQAGDTIKVAPGNYGADYAVIENNGIEGLPITIEALNNDYPVLEGYTGYNGVFHINSKSYVNINGFEIINPQISGVLVKDSQYVNISNVKVSNAGYISIWFDDNVHHSIVDRCEVDGGGWNSIMVFGSDFEGHNRRANSNIVVSNNKVYNNSIHNGIDIHSNNHDILVINNTVHDNPGQIGIFVHSAQSPNYNITVTNNTVYSNYRGIYVHSTHDSKILNNTVFDHVLLTGIDIYSGKEDPLPTIPYVPTHDLIIENNLLYNNYYNIRLMNSNSSEHGTYNITLKDNEVRDAVHSYGIDLYFYKSQENIVVQNMNSKTTNQYYSYFISANPVTFEYTDGNVFTETSSAVPKWYPDKSTLSTSKSVRITPFELTVVPLTNSADITLNKFNTSLTQGNILVDFTADTTGGNNVVFTVNELPPNHYYLIKKDGANFTTTQANSSGSIQFSNSEWDTNHIFTIEETASVNSGDSGEGPSITEFFPVDTTPDQNNDSTYEFNVTVNESLTSSEWYLDGSMIASDTLSLDHMWTHASTHDITFTGSNDNGSVSQTWIVNVNDGNNAPVFVPVDAKSVDEGNTLSFTISATDADGDSLTYSATNLPTGASFNPDTCAFSWTPDENQAGSYQVHFEVTDGSLSDAEDVTIIVNEVDTTPPIITNIISSSITSSTVTISWTTDEPAISQVEYGPDTGYGSSTSLDSNPVTSHSITITGLNNNTIHQYRVKSQDANANLAISGNYNFTTLSIDTDIAGLWHFDEGDGTTVADSSGNSNDGTISGASWTEGMLGTALQFDGIDDYISIPDSPALNPASEITIETWVRPGSLPQAGWNKIIAKPYTSQASPWQQYALTLHDNQFIFELNAGGTKDVVTGTEILTPDTWYHVTGTYDGSEMRIYVNGELSGTQSKSGAIAVYPTDVHIGAGIYSNAQTEFINGTIDEVRILGRALSADEVRADYESGLEDTPNQAPAMDAIGDRSIETGTLLQFIISATDPDSDPLTYSATNPPTGATFDPATCAFSWTPGENQASSYEVHFEVTDGSLSDAEDVMITVNAAPVEVNMTLYEGWNLVALPVINDGFTASSLASAIGDVSYVMKRNTSDGGYQDYIVGFSGDADDFVISPDEGYYVYLNVVQKDFTISGTQPGTRSIDLTEGWNLVGWTSMDPSDAVAAFVDPLGSDIKYAAKRISPYGDYENYVVGFSDPVDNFNVEPGYGYFVYVTSNCTWVHD